MRYLPSDKVKAEDTAYDKLASNSWAVKTGLIDSVIKKNKMPQIGRALDIGCGSGSTGLFLKQFFNEIYGADISSYLTNNAKELIKFSKIDLNFERLPYPDENFDLVTAFQVIEHLENPFLIMREAHRVLRPEGFLILSIPNPFQITYRLKFLLWGNMPPYTKHNNHLLFMTRDVFAKTYLENFELIDTIYQKGDIPFWGRLGMVFGKKRIGKHKKILPPSELLGRCVCYILKKK